MKKFLALALIAVAMSSSVMAEPTGWEKFKTCARVYAPWYSTESLKAKKAYYEALSAKATEQADKDFFIAKSASYKKGYTTPTANKIERNPATSALTAATAVAVAVVGYKYRAQIKKALCEKCPFTKAKAA